MVIFTPPVGLSRQLVEDENRKKSEQRKADCLARGWIWDEKNQTCTDPKAEERARASRAETDAENIRRHQEEQAAKEKTGEFGVLKDAETGRLSGYTRGDKTFLGLSPTEVTDMATQEAKLQDIPIGIGGQAGGKLSASQVLEQNKVEEAIAAERQRLIAEETPERRELQEEAGFLEEVPVIGGSVVAGRNIGNQIKNALGIETYQSQITSEELRTEALTQIEKQEIERGLTASESFGAFVEGIPVIGKLASQFAGGLIETPSENAAQVKSNLLKEKRRISNIETNVKLGYLPVETARAQLEDIENNVQRLESRLRLLINNSPELRYNSDLVNTYETEVLLTKEKILQGKLNILTGASRDPTELQLLQQLQTTGDLA